MEIQPIMVRKRIEEVNTAQTVLEAQDQQINVEQNPQ